MGKKIWHWFLRTINYYFEYIPKRAISKDKIISKSEFLNIGKKEMPCLVNSGRIYGFPFDYSNGLYQKQGYLSLQRNVCFLGNSGVILASEKIILESAFDEIRLLKSPSFRRPSFLRKKIKRGVYTSILHLPWAQSNIFHWIIDCLPRLYSLKQLETKEKINFIVNNDIELYQLEILNFFVGEDDRFQICYIGKKEKWLIDEFWLPSFVTNPLSGFLPEPYLKYVKDTIYQGYSISPKGLRKRIYISRKNAKRRKIINEDEIVFFLQKHGFDIIYAEKLSYRDQVKLFSEATHIIGCHGAGLTNLLFANSASVLEIQSSDLIKSHYCLLSKACKHSYYSIFGGIGDKSGNFFLDLGEFQVVFNQMINDPKI